MISRSGIGLSNRQAASQGTANAIYAVVLENEEHNHNVERWWGATGAPDETNAIAATVTVPFQAASGNDTWGTAIPILGTADNPVLTDQTLFDAHRILVVDLDDETDPWRFRIIWGTGTSGDAITAGQWSEIMIESNVVPGSRAGAIPVDIRMPQIAVGSKLWAQVWNDSAAEVLSFYYGCHGYPYPPA